MPVSTLPKIIVILGPTAGGKTALAIKLAKKFNGEIISADSRQIYKNLKIGSGQPPGRWRKVLGGKAYVAQGIRHHLIAVFDPANPVSVAEYKVAAEAAIQEIYGRGRLPFLVGGTGLYIQTVVDNWQIPFVPPDRLGRAERSAENLGKLVDRLLSLDAAAAQTVDLKNRRRVERALEGVLATGATVKKLLRQKGEPKFAPLLIGLDPPIEILRLHIIRRVERQFAAGLVAEARKLLASGYATGLPGLSGIGYPEVFSYLRGELTVAEARKRIFFATAKYAKRQRTWFKRDGRIKWLTDEEAYLPEAQRLIADFIAESPFQKIQSFLR